jgi:methyl-accepting chemotaxis protein
MLPACGMFLFGQDGELAAISPHDVHLMMIFLFIIALALAAQAVGIIVAAGFAAKLLTSVNSLANEMREKIHPLLDKTDVLVRDLSPKIKSISENVDQISYAARSKADEVGVTVSRINETVNEINRTLLDVNGRTRTHIARVDGMVAGALDTTAQVSQTVQEGIKAPVRQMAGLVTGLRVGMETFLEKQGLKRRKIDPDPYDL